MMTYTISTDACMMDDFEAIDLSDALDQFGEAPAHVRDADAFATWLNRIGGYGYIEEDGVRIVNVRS